MRWIPIRRALGILGLAPFLSVALGTAPAIADPWVPPAGGGVVKPMVRQFNSHQAYSPYAFGTNRLPSGPESKTEYRITGVQGLGGGFSLEYDLRAALARKSTTRHRHVVSTTAWGLEDQEIGLNYGLRQTPGFADSVTLNVVVPTGSSTTDPQLGTGHWEIEPDFQIGVAQGRFNASLKLGPRQFLDGAVTQLRADSDFGFRATHWLTLGASAFYVRSIQNRSSLAPDERGELYNRLRLGVGATVAVTRQIRPFVAYEADVAGQGIHAGQRITIGLALHY